MKLPVTPPPHSPGTLYLVQTLGVAIRVSQGPSKLHGQLVGADELWQLLLPVACGSKREALWGSGLTEGRGDQALGSVLVLLSWVPAHEIAQELSMATSVGD